MKTIQNFLREGPSVTDDINSIVKKNLIGGVEKLPGIKKQAKNLADDVYRTIKDKTDQMKAMIASEKEKGKKGKING